MAIWDKWLDNAVERLGFIKATGAGISTIFAGETPYSGTLHLSTEAVERLAVTCSWVFSDIQLLSQMLSPIPFGVHRKEKEALTPIESHPFETLFEWPNPFMDQSWLLEYSSWWYWLRGESYWMLVPDEAGQLSEIWPLPASRMRPVPDKKKYIRGYTYTSTKDGRPQFLPPESICYVRRPNPFDFHRGMSPISAYRLALESDKAANEWNRDAYKKGLSLQTILSLPETLTTTQFEAIKDDIRRELESRNWRWLITRSGDLTAKEVGITHRDADYLAGRAFTRDEIDRIHGIPEGFWSVHANRANAEAARASVIENALWPVAVKFARAITGQILFRYYGNDIRGRFEDIRPRDRRLIVEEHRLNWQGYTFDEVRQELGKDPFPDIEVGSLPFAWVARGMHAQEASPWQDAKALRDDLRRWQSIAIRRFRNAGDPAGYDFESEHISASAKAQIMEQLESATTEEEVKVAFATGFQSPEAYP